jgi:hypothetical protein
VIGGVVFFYEGGGMEGDYQVIDYLSYLRCEGNGERVWGTKF